MQGVCLSLCLALQAVQVVVGENAGLADPDLSKIKFLLWTRQNPTDYDTVELNQESLENSHFDSRHPTIILAHGWNSHGQGFGGDLSEAYLQVGDYNVFAIEWGDLETWANYPQAAVRTRAVGEHSANLVKVLSDVGAFDNIHVVGHSLGAHVGGFLAKKVKAMGLGTLDRLTGLDPAEPFFDIAGPDERIDKSDANFVDIIHTNSGMLWNGCLSIKKSIGHVDIYPAGGSHQPGCVEACIIPNIMCYNITIEDLIKGGCSHNRAVQYYKESITSHNFIAWNCHSWEDFQEGNCCGQDRLVMGEWTDNRATEGKYFMDVGEEKPYGLGEAGNACRSS